MTLTTFSSLVAASSARCKLLDARRLASTPEAAEEAIEELATALEELRVADEELRQQNEELVTARDRVERERRRYEDLFQNAPDASMITDPLGIVREANRVACSLVNVDGAELIGKPLSVYIAPDECRAFRDMLSAISGGARGDDWHTAILARGRVAPRAVAATARLGADPVTEVPIVRWTFRDVSAYKKLAKGAERVDERAWYSANLRTRALADENDRLRERLSVVTTRILAPGDYPRGTPPAGPADGTAPPNDPPRWRRDPGDDSR